MDYADAAIHAGVAILAIAIGAGLIAIMPPLWALATLNAIVWPVREAAQRFDRGDVWWRFSANNVLEAVAPAAAGFALAAIL